MRKLPTFRSLPVLWAFRKAFLALLLFTISSSLFAQNIDVSGKILDADSANYPLIGVSVIVKGSTKGTATNNKGEFTLRDVAPRERLVISMSGYVSQEIEARNINMNRPIHLKNSVADLSEVVITGYQTIKKKLFSGSSSTLSAKEVERAGMPDITKMLEGQFAGVSLQNVSGTFGAAPKLRIRGASSLSGDNKPLWVIDGIVIEDVVNISNEALSTGDMNTLLGSSVAGINPDDIQDITILRDAAATALYGARAMNGVVVVTTKKGRKSSEPRINYSGNYSMYLKPNYTEFDILNSADQMAVMVELQNKGYYQMPGILNGSDGGVFNKMYNLIEKYDSSTNTFGLRNDAASRNTFLQRYADANTDWFDIIFKNSFIQEHSLSISSGTDRFQTYASTSYLKDDGQTIGNSVERLTGNFRTNFKLGKRFSGELLTTGSVRNQRAPGTQSQRSEPVYGTYLRGFDINPYNYAMNTSRMTTAYDENGDLEYFRKNFAPFNIINELNSNYMKMNVLDFKFQGKAEYKILPQLNYAITGAYRYVKSENQTSILENSNMVQAYKAASNPTTIGSNTYLYDDPEQTFGYPMVVLPSGGFYNMSSNSLKSYYLRQELRFDKTFNEDHTVTAFGSMEMRSADRQDEFFDGVGYQFENGGLVSPYYMYFKQAGEAGKAYFGMKPGYDRYLAYMFQTTYAYKGKYIFTPTVRYDGSNKMGMSKTARWLPTWNVAGSWNVHEENFWPENNILTSATIRGSYGLVANIGNATNSSAVFYNMIARRPYLNDQETLTYISNLENSELTWEKSRDLNLGLELGFLNNRFSLMVDLYQRKIQDLLGNIRTSGIGGESQKYGNYATMLGQGVEFTLMGRPVQTKDFTWNMRANLSVNKNKITNLEVDPSIWSSVSPNGSAVKGYPQRGLFAIEFAGLDHYFGYPKYIGVGETKPVTTYVSLQGNNIDNLGYMGPIDPTVTGGFHNQFRYRNFNISGLLKFGYGNMIRLSPSIAASYSDMSSMSRDILNRWVMPGDEMKTSIPALIDAVTATQIVDANGGQVSSVYPYNLYNYSNERVAKGDYVKLSSITLGYNLPVSITTRLGLSNASLSLGANNLWIIYSDPRLNGQDPEFFSSGGVALPESKKITLALKIGL